MLAQIFGRDAELLAIGEFVGRLARGPGALVLAGPAGAGKTTLLRSGAGTARDSRFTVLQTSPSRQDFPLAFAGLADLLGPQMTGVVSQLPRPQARALGIALLAEEASAYPPEPREIAAATRTALGVLSRAGPVLLVVDDLQWLDRPSAAALGFALRRLADEPIGLLGAERADEPGPLPLELGRGPIPADILPVGGLSFGALHRMLRTRIGASFSYHTLRRIEAESGGNPFIALEIGRALARRQVTSVGTAALPVPATLAALVQERLAELPPEAMDAVRLVAVSPEATVAQYLRAGASAADMDAAVLGGVLESDGSRLRFAHPLLASAILGAIPPGRRRELHVAAAGIARRPEEKAWHQALGADGPSAPTSAKLEEAALAAAARGAPATAADLLELAVRLTPEDRPADARRRRRGAARQLAHAGETRAARAALEELVAALPAGPERAGVLSQLSWLHDGDLAAAITLLTQALAEAGDEAARTADIHFSLSEIWTARGDQQRGRAEARLALADAERSGDAALLAAALAQVFLEDMLGGMEVDQQLLERALELERSVGSMLLRSSPSQVAGIWHFVEGRLDESEAALLALMARTDADGIEYWRADGLLRLARLAGRRGHAHRAVQLAAEGLQIAEQLDLPHPICALLYGCAAGALLLGQADTVRELAGRGMELAERTGDPYALFHRALLGSLELALGDYPAAASWFRPLASELPQIGWHPSSQAIAPDLLEALIAVGALDEAADFLAELERAMSDPVTAAITARCRGALEAARGNLDAAIAELTQALELHDQVSPQPMERGRTLLVLGGVQRRLKQRKAGRATLSEAVSIFDGIGAVLWAERARAELARISGRAPGSEQLTTNERRVAELVSRGLTNRAVAAELFVTVRAVESTLTTTYAKLGVRSRTELAARLRQR